MNGSLLLDTNIVIALFDSERAMLRKRKRAERVFLPSIVVGELFYGPIIRTRCAKMLPILNRSLWPIPCFFVTRTQPAITVKSKVNSGGTGVHFPITIFGLPPWRSNMT